jgi:hypothetical protein
MRIPATVVMRRRFIVNPALSIFEYGRKRDGAKMRARIRKKVLLTNDAKLRQVKGSYQDKNKMIMVAQ